MSSSAAAHGKDHDAHGHDAHGHDAHGHGAHGAPHDVPAFFGVAGAATIAVAAFALQFTIGPMSGGGAAHHEGHAAAAAFPKALEGPADLIFTNAKVVAPGHEAATTVVVGGGKILAVGSSELLLRKGEKTVVRDLKGAALVPGLHDAHGHLLDLGRKILDRECDLTGSQSLEDVKERLATWVKIHAPRPGDWIVGHGWDESLWEELSGPDPALVAKARAAYERGDKEEGARIEKELEARGATKVQAKVPDSTEALDEVAADNPVILYRADGHMAWVNHRSLELAKIGHDSFDPADGRILRDAKGEPSGILVDGAIGLVAGLEPAEKPESIEEDLVAACRACARAGLVEVHDAGVDGATENALRRLAIAHKLPIRVYAMIGRGGKDLIERLGHKPDSVALGGRLVVRAVKMYADGALGSHGALLLEPYADEPQHSGVRRTKVEEIQTIANLCLERGYQLCIHAIGDRANRDVLDAFEKTFAEHKKATGKGAGDVRFRVEHAQVIAPGDLERFGRLGVIASMQPRHATTDMRWAEQRVGSDRLRGAYAWRTLTKEHARLAFGSDFPVEPQEPLLGLYAAVTRQDAAGQPAGGWRPEERLTPEEALAGFTTGAAYAAFEEGVRGEILPGQDADFTVLARDPLETLAKEPRKLLETRVLGTWVGGEEVPVK